MRILVVEDDSRVASFIRRGLREEHYTVDTAKDGEDALFLAQTNEYDLIILDIMLPKKSGLEVLKTLRQERVHVPVLVLTAKDELQDKVNGLNAGADDYLTKPFGFEELLARVRALLRRRGEMVPTVLRIEDLEMDVLRHRVTRSGRLLNLTAREHGILEYMLRHADELVTRTMLAEHVWEHDFDPLSNVIDVHIARLRQKIDQGFSPPLLQTIRGRGYLLKAPEHSKKVIQKT
ncbi:MAG: response regulator transcription factor [Candidatus Omnitrophica bacterium]|nr:response regulator transcription factor [Candidatus Omnitrophota bacterium]MBI2173737.1 response regulator transcription factor [Candidatus Omnitrophota bacterium]